MFFSMGAIKYLIDNNLYEQFDTISGVSGATLLMMFLEPCYANGYTKENNWYDTYVRNVIYQLINERLLGRTLLAYLNPLNYFKQPAQLLSEITAPLFNTALKPYNQKMSYYEGKIFKFNYIDVDTWHISSDHSDLFNLEKGEFSDSWWGKRMMRCCLPFAYSNNKRSMDAGLIDNNAISNVITEYKFKKILSVTTETDFLNLDQQKNEATSIFQVLMFAISNIFDWSTEPSNILNIHLSTTILRLLKDNGVDISIVYPEWNEKLYTNPDSIKSKFYNGMLFCDEAIARITENLGYIQMHKTITNSNDITNITLPNPEYSTDDIIKSNFTRFENTSNLKYIFNDIIYLIKKAF
jgi:hypothetical protein